MSQSRSELTLGVRLETSDGCLQLSFLLVISVVSVSPPFLPRLAVLVGRRPWSHIPTLNLMSIELLLSIAVMAKTMKTRPSGALYIISIIIVLVIVL